MLMNILHPRIVPLPVNVPFIVAVALRPLTFIEKSGVTLVSYGNALISPVINCSHSVAANKFICSKHCNNNNINTTLQVVTVFISYLLLVFCRMLFNKYAYMITIWFSYVVLIKLFLTCFHPPLNCVTPIIKTFTVLLIGVTSKTMPISNLLILAYN